MSTLRVYNIENPSTAAGGIGIATDGSVTVGGLQYPTAGPLSNRNMIINGKFEISQRGTTFTYSGTGQDHTVYNSDRFLTQTFGSSFPSGDYLQITQDTDVPNSEFKNSQKIEVLQDISWGSGPNGVWTKQAIEGNNISNLGFGGSNPSSITLSFWVKATKTGTFTATIKDSTSTEYYMCPVTIESANTWQYVTKTIPGATSGTWNTDNTTGLQVLLTWGINPGWIAGTTINQWASGNISGTTTQTNFLSTDGDTVWVTGVQLEVGERATPFEHRSYGDELAKCQRYFYRNNAEESYTRFAMGIGAANVNAQILVNHPVGMRTDPTVGDSGSGTLQLSDTNTGTVTNAALSIIANVNGTLQSSIRADVASGLTQFRPYILEASNNSNAYIEFSAEL